MADTRKKKALIAGATGLVGGYVLRRLLAHPSYSQVEILVRHESPVHDPKLTQHIVDFARLDAGVPGVAPDDVFCCLGTTIGKAGSEEAFRRVDFDYPLALARLAKAVGAGKFLTVSALGADPKSAVFYNRVKGEVEQAIAAIGLPAAHFFRPSLLLGPRAESRPAEKIGIAVGTLITPLMIGGLRKYRPIHADTVAAAMVYAANHDVPAGVIESDAIARLGLD
ncbi:MAG TPA: oxidoreductase [Burkholderiales bacterium]|nr:oxidoreductase [Burkholderiales bacterium]